MSPTEDHEITRLLGELSRGQRDAAGRLYQLMYDELHRTAAAFCAVESPGHTLQPTAVINELWLRLLKSTAVEAQSRKHFLVLAARMMRRLLIDHARGKDREKRRRTRVPLVDNIPDPRTSQFDVLALHEAIEKLACINSDRARLAE